MNKELISELQSFFDGRSKLNYAAMAIKCYTQKSTLFYACVDGFGNKRTINIPIEPTDLLPIIERYLDNIDKEIINISSISAMPVDYNVIIEEYNKLKEYICDYERRYPETFTSYYAITKEISEQYKARMLDMEDPGSEQADYLIPVCSDWEDKVYLFNFDKIDDATIHVTFNGIYKQ